MEVPGRKNKDYPTQGTQSQFDFYCQPCDANNSIHLEAEGYCQTCKEYLCEICFKHHKTPTIMKHHVLQDKEQMPRASLPSTPKPTIVCTELCHVHAGEIIKYFCGAHKQLGCSECLRLSHNGCKGVLYIPEAATDAKHAQEYTHLKTSLEELLHSMEQLKKDTQENMIEAKRCEDEALVEIDNFQEKVALFFDRLTDTMKKNVKSRKSQTDSALQKRCATVEDMLDRTRQWTSDLARKHGLESKGDLFIAVKNGEKELLTMTREIEGWKQTDQYRNFVFKPNDELADLMSRQIDLGSLDDLLEPEDPEISLIPQPFEHQLGLTIDNGQQHIGYHLDGEAIDNRHQQWPQFEQQIEKANADRYQQWQKGGQKMGKANDERYQDQDWQPVGQKIGKANGDRYQQWQKGGQKMGKANDERYQDQDWQPVGQKIGKANGDRYQQWQKGGQKMGKAIDERYQDQDWQHVGQNIGKANGDRYQQWQKVGQKIGKANDDRYQDRDWQPVGQKIGKANSDRYQQWQTVGQKIGKANDDRYQDRDWQPVGQKIGKANSDKYQ